MSHLLCLLLFLVLPLLSSSHQPAFAQTPYLWGVTSDNCMEDSDKQVDALKRFPKRVVVRTVFDLPDGDHPQAADYVPCVKAFADVADVMGLLVDSHDMENIEVDDLKDRVKTYLDGVGKSIQIWEIGNEINGNWVGDNAVDKIEVVYDAVKKANKQTALTFYYEPSPNPGFDMIPWIDVHIPDQHRLRTGLDYVFVSYYEDENDDHQLTQVELEEMFNALAERFPNAKLGIGEFGWGNKIPDDANVRKALLRQFYQYRPEAPRYIGGGFYWHFRQTMSAKNAPDHAVLLDLMIQERTKSPGVVP